MGLGKAAKVGSRGTGEAEELCGSSVAATFESGQFLLYVNGTDFFRSRRIGTEHFHIDQIQQLLFR